MTTNAIDEVLDFWFGACAGTDPEATAKAKESLWWGGDAATDRLIAERFGASRALAVSGALEGWTASPRGRLARIILVDQFSRNIHRGRPGAFEHDPLSLRWCVEGLDAGADRSLSALERVFFYLPLEHAESRQHQARSVALYESLAAQVEPPLRERFENYADFARRHRAVIDRFGRFPHRNAILGRPSTEEEREFLRTPGSSF